MKPIKLIISAFGSYAGEVTVDFSKVQQGIFLVTGDTGSGKTTIFDAITFALYDRTSGMKREGAMMRSQYAGPETKTFVEFTFSHCQEQYSVRRNPEYRRKKKRNTGGRDEFTTERAQVSLTMPDGSDYPGNKTEINRKIVEILGLDVQQFTQIVMIAQGDFLKLLHAQSQERKQIFGKIFNTSIYWRIQEELKNMAREARENLEDYEKNLLRETERAECPEDYPEKEKWEEIRGSRRPDSNSVLYHLEKMGKLGEERQQEIQKHLEEREKRLGELQRYLKAAESVNELFLQFEKAEKYREELKKKFPSMKELESRLASLKGASLAAEKEEQMEMQNRFYQQIKEERIQEEREVLAWKKLMEIYQAAPENLGTALKEISGETVKAQAAKLQRLTEERVLLQNKKIQTAADVERKEEAYEAGYRSFLEAQAGLLAQELKEGTPCPVCGSVHHPNKASLPEGAADQRRTEALKKSLEDARKKLDQAAQVLQKSEQACSDQYQECLQEIGRRQGKAEQLRGQEEQERKKKIREKEKFQQALLEAGLSKEEYEKIKEDRSQAEEWQKNLDTYREECIRADENYRRCSEMLQGKKKMDTEETERMMVKLQEEKRLLERESHRLFAENEKNREIKRLVEELKKEGERQKEEYEVILTLSRTANGTLNQSIKMDFETYVQRKFFGYVIRCANQRFVEMTSGQLMLRLREIKHLSTQGQAGLDLDVYSPVTGSVRDVKTLSGGESFMAALSMALGMSDVISAAAGAVRMDTMFIDEGFGSLDEEARERAVGILNQLAGSSRLVGIISHVEELKDQIDCRLVVSKTEKGSQVRWEM
ncbi:MAG: AAA family ATPase [Ruminococcus sp.]|jgi:exonuclease SbcC